MYVKLQFDVQVKIICAVFVTSSPFYAPCAENAKINVTDEPYFGTYILCNYLPFSKADKGAQGGPQQHETPKHSPTDISKRLRS